MRQDWFGWRSARRVGQLRLACSSPESMFATSLCQSVGRYPPPHGICAGGRHAALPYSELPTFIEDLHQRTAVAARALEFLISTATRTSEALNATWEEFNLEEA